MVFLKRITHHGQVSIHHDLLFVSLGVYDATYTQTHSTGATPSEYAVWNDQVMRLNGYKYHLNTRHHVYLFPLVCFFFCQNVHISQHQLHFLLFDANVEYSPPIQGHAGLN